MSGHLPQYLISRSSLKTALEIIARELQSSHHQYELINKNVSWYYQKGAFIYTSTDTTLFVTVKFPLTAMHTKFRIYKVDTYPLMLHDDSPHMMFLENLPAGLAVDEGNIY